MIESSLLCSSHWDSDPFEDLELISDVSSFDVEELSFTLDNESFKGLSGSSSPLDINSSSSEYDCLLLDGEIDERILPVNISDTFVSKILEDENISGFSELDWLTHARAFSECENECNETLCHSPDYDPAFKSDPFEWILKDGRPKWSKMTQSDQLNTLHALSDIVTYHMSIAEQMLVIRVINPSAVITPDDKEFALDSTHLTDTKLRKIKEIITKHRHQLPESSHTLKSPKKSSSTKLMSRRDREKSTFCRTKRKQKKQKLESTHTLESQKRLRQNKKELKSGFFLREMKILINPKEEEDEDVNILE